jgi:hypothetical protein
MVKFSKYLKRFGIVAGVADNGVISLEIGQAYSGGYFAGYISHTADGVATHALIVAPAATGASGTGYTISTNLRWKTSQTSTAGTSSSFDGAANTAAMIAAGASNHPAAKFCDDLTINEFSDWYLPARDELDIAYHNLKPTTNTNNISSGINNYSVPKRTANRTTTDPGQTSVTVFQSGNSEAFYTGSGSVGNHLTSTEATSSATRFIDTRTGESQTTNKDNLLQVRAFRKVAI